MVEIRVHQLLHRFYGGPQGWILKFGALTDDQVAALRPVGEPVPAPARLEPEDEPLLAVLERDGRAGYPELQRATGRSESSVRRRLAALRASGAVYTDVEYQPQVLGHTVVAALWITAAPAALHSVGEALAGHEQTAWVSATAGPSNLVVTALARDTAGLYAYLSGPLGQLEGVQHVDTAIFQRRVKQLTYPVPR